MTVTLAANTRYRVTWRAEHDTQRSSCEWFDTLDTAIIFADLLPLMCTERSIEAVTTRQLSIPAAHAIADSNRPPPPAPPPYRRSQQHPPLNSATPTTNERGKPC